MPLRLSLLIGALVVAVAGLASVSAVSGSGAALEAAGTEVRQAAEAEGSTVALAPGPEWLGIGRLTVAGEHQLDLAEVGTVVFAPTEGSNLLGRIVFVTQVSDPLPTQDPPAPTIAVGILDGYHGVDPYSGHTWLMAGRGERHLNLWAGPGVSVEELVALAASLDLTRPIELQKPESPWRVVTWAQRSLSGGVVRDLQASRSNLGADLHIAAFAGVDELALLLIGNATVADLVEVRGRLGLASTPGGPEGATVTLAWLEQPGLVAQLTYHAADDPDGGTDLLAHAIAAADGLTPVDLAGWGALASGADAQSAPPKVDPASVPRVVFSGDLGDGRTFVLDERAGAILCVSVDGIPAVQRCDTNPRHWRGWSRSAVPRLVDPDDLTGARSPVIAYGYLPDRVLGGDFGRVQEAIGPELPVGRAVAVDIADRRGRDMGRATIVGDIWVHLIPNVEMGLVVTYTFLDGTQIDVLPGPGRGDGDGSAR